MLDRRCLRYQPAITEKNEREEMARRSRWGKRRVKLFSRVVNTGIGQGVRIFTFFGDGRTASREPELEIGRA